jgi:hypothetical protein
VMRDLFAGSVAAVNPAKISRLLDEFNQNVPQISNSEIDLTDDTEPEMKEKLQKLEAENSVTSESLVKSLKSLKESSFEKSKLNNELSQSVLKNNELLKENSRLKNLQASCQKEMKLLKETEEKGKNCQNSFDLLESFQKNEVSSRNVNYTVHVLADDSKADKLLRQKIIDEKKLKSDKKIKTDDYKRKRGLEKVEVSKRRKLEGSFLGELKSVEKNRKSIELIDAPLSASVKGRSIRCDKKACNDRQNENYVLKEIDEKVTIAAALAYRQMLCTLAFCKYTQNFLEKSDFHDTTKLFTYIYQLLPRYISAFAGCANEMDTVKSILAVKEAKTWKWFGKMLPNLESSYLFCQDLLACSYISADDLNLCRDCPKKIAGHPPKTCNHVTVELNNAFSRKRAMLKYSLSNQDLAFDQFLE